MRPLKITMTAFGPYKHREIIDFTELKNNRLFVVSGNTGAGKTTIFDAICFALYGSASGEDRNDSKFMRSDFADDDVHTSVELEFELHNRYYRILRQLSHVKEGNKGATGEKYEFFEKVDGKEIPCVDRQIVSEINKKVEAIVGLTKDQFSQIVMLPQGEFRKLLTSQTENKEEILRKIFKTEPYRWISERLKEKKKSAEEDYKREAQTRDRYITDILATLPEREESKLFKALAQEHYNTNQIIDGLEEETDFYQSEILKNLKESEIMEEAYNKKFEEYHQVKALNERFQELENKETKLLEYTEQIPVFKEKEKQLENAERASKIEAYEKQVNEKRQEEREKKQALINAEIAKNKSVELREKAQTLYEVEEKKKEEREAVSNQLTRYQDYLPIVKEIDSKKSELIMLDNDVKRLNREIEENLLDINEKKSSKENLNLDIRKTEQLVEQLPIKNQRLVEMRDQVRVIQEYLKYNQKHAELENVFQLKQKSYQEVKNQYEKLEEAWVSGQASILAAHLHDGKPCPVCGSIEHPNKAGGQDTVPTKDELEKVKKDLESKDSQYRDASASLKSNKDLLDTRIQEVIEIGFHVDDAELSYKSLVAEGKQLKHEVDVLEEEKKKLSTFRKLFDETEKTLKQLEEKREFLSKAYHEVKTSFESKKAVYQAQIGRIPEEIRVLAVLEEKIAETQKRKEKLEKDWEAAQKQLQQATKAEAESAAFHLSAQKQLKESKEKLKRSEAEFSLELQKAQFTSEDEYLRAKISDSERKLLKESIDNFNQNFNTLKQQILDLQVELKDKTKVDLATLTDELTQLKNAYDHGVDLLRQSKQNEQKAIELKTKILDSEKTVINLERQLNIIADLYDVIRGQNSSKVSFERYLQIEYLEEIIIAANERLKHLSNGQFLLMRSDRQESRGKQSGLGLDVFDSYTGQTRDVKTLSGGEKFNASLCLALGMADVIQSFQGGVSIDTMFIDEGFGSLDEESLNKAIDTLIDLQKSGRMIGVISHVQELKNAIPAILEVKKTKEGYSQTQFVLK
jgi:DNA repair protein SbcC/Rad50